MSPLFCPNSYTFLPPPLEHSNSDFIHWHMWVIVPFPASVLTLMIVMTYNYLVVCQISALSSPQEPPLLEVILRGH